MDGEGEGEGIDRISDLPNVILHHIFSFLKTKQIIRTSILSKRWLDLWISSPELCFFSKRDDDSAIFFNLVERALTLRDSSIEKFFLGCDMLSGSDASRFSQLICAALGHKVQVLILWVENVEEVLELPASFTCESLTSLTLNADGYVKLPSFSWFPNLKILNIENVVFPDQLSTMQLFCGCPAVEELTIKYCSWENVHIVCIALVNLRKLDIRNDRADVSLDTDDDIDDVDYSSSRITICAGFCLESFSFYGELKYYYKILPRFPIKEASVKISRGRPCRDLADRVDMLLRGLSNVFCLQLCSVTVEALTYEEELLASLPVLCNLLCLRFLQYPLEFNGRALQKILHNAPILIGIEFSGGSFLETDEQGEWMLDPVPQCLSKLEWCAFGDFSGFQSELNAVEMLLKSATVLKILIIAFSFNDHDMDPQKLEEDKEVILSLPRASRDCVIMFFDGDTAFKCFLWKFKLIPEYARASF